MFIYHYQAENRFSTLRGITVSSIDGIAHLNREITDMDSYREFKALIVKDTSPQIDPSTLIICSLTLLGKTEV